MKKKLFIISIPMLPTRSLKALKYRYPDGILSRNTCFPGIALLEKYMQGKAPIKVITVRTADDNQRAKECYSIFRKELDSLSVELDTVFENVSEITVPHTESEEKSRFLLRELLNAYEKGSYIYMDLTFGTKLTAIELFSSLFFAERCHNCSIKTVVYGKYAFDSSEIAELYDVTKLYHMLRFLETSVQMDKASFSDLTSQMLEW